MLLKLVSVETDEPVETEEHRVEQELLQLIRDELKLSWDQLLEYFNINLDSYQLSVVIDR